MRRRARIVGGLTALLIPLGGLGVAAVTGPPDLSAHGPTAVAGTDATAVFRVASRQIRQVRYDDRQTLTYSFELSNDGRLPVTVTGLAPFQREPRLFRLTGLVDERGHERFTVGAGERSTVRVRLLMHACETLSARAGSFATEIRLETTRTGLVRHDVLVELPEELHTGSPREAFCPRATASSRPPG